MLKWKLHCDGEFAVFLSLFLFHFVHIFTVAQICAGSSVTAFLFCSMREDFLSKYYFTQGTEGNKRMNNLFWNFIYFSSFLLIEQEVRYCFNRGWRFNPLAWSFWPGDCSSIVPIFQLPSTEQKHARVHTYEMHTKALYKSFAVYTKRVIRMVHRAGYLDHTSALFFKLGILKFKDLI